MLLEHSLYRAVRAAAVTDRARPAGAIVVMGAAEFDGHPSPVFRARLDHAFDLEQRGLSKWLITTGGSGGDPHFTEAEVGRDYLIQEGMNAARILTEDRGKTTYQSVEAVASILHRIDARTCIAVSDGFHLYRVKVMFAAFGIRAYGSPVPNSSIEDDPYLRTLYSLREMLNLTLWDLHIRV
ncbi:MAG TPA: YdcF family protein [Terriglobia bacterium]|nr:YdcF family protein [Terriglobia bacterium]